MTLIDVLDNRHLKLSGQTDHGSCRKKRQGYPFCPEDITAAVDCLGADAGEDISRSVCDNESGENADRDQRQEFNDGLKRNGCDHAVMALVGIKVARAEQDREKSHAGGDPECCRRAVIVTGDDLIAVGHRLQLQGDIRCNRDHGDHSHQYGEAWAFAVSGRNQIGNRRDSVCPANPHQLAQQPPPADEDQCRTQINGDEFKAASGRGSDRAVECPRCAIDRNGQGIDDRRLQPADRFTAGPPVDNKSDGEQQCDISQTNEQKDIYGKHQPGVSASPLRATSLSLSRRGFASRAAPTISNAQTPNR